MTEPQQLSLWVRASPTRHSSPFPAYSTEFPRVFGQLDFEEISRVFRQPETDQFAPLSLQDVLHVTVFPPRHDLHTPMH